MTADNNNNSNNSSGNTGVALEVGNSLPVGFTGLYELHGLGNLTVIRSYLLLFNYY